MKSKETKEVESVKLTKKQQKEAKVKEEFLRKNYHGKYGSIF